jgi:Flp pilus assembly protein TadG
MAMKAPLHRLLRTMRAFCRARQGNVALTFALSLIPLMIAVGAAVDYSHANAVRSALQAAIDSTALMLSKEAPNLTNEQLTQKATGYFNALFNKPEALDVTLTPTYTTVGGSQVRITASAKVPTSFMGIVGIPKIDIGTSATVSWGNTRLRVALVLDNTGSMSQAGKMSALKTATKNLLSQLQGAVSQNGDVYVSIIPFVKDVAVDTSNYGASWIDWTDWDNNNGSCQYNGNGNAYGWGNNVNDKSTCTQKGGSWKSANHNTWNGCITDRGDMGGPSSANYDTNVAPPTAGVTASLFPPEQYSACPQAVKGLSYDWSAMTTLVNNMSPNGNTNQAIGLVWGWMSLVGGGPFTVPPMDSNYKYQQIIILFTDGLNTQDRWYTDQSSIDARQKMTCDNVKAAGIKLYTIQVNTGGDPTSTLLQNCASDSSKFFLLTSADQIVTTFNQIGTALTQLRISK